MNYIERLNQLPNKEKILESIEKEKEIVAQVEKNLEQVSEEFKGVHSKYIEIRKNGVKRFEEEIQKIWEKD